MKNNLLFLITFIYLVSASSAFANSVETLLSEPFQAGVNHVDGRYAFTTNNFLIEGAQKTQSLGLNSIFLYLTPNFAAHYPIKNGIGYGNPTNLTQLAKSAPYKQVFDMPFRMFVLTTFSWATGDGGYGHFANQNSPTAAAETAEIKELVVYLEKTYQGTGKVFILKNWEGDWATQSTINGSYGDQNAPDPQQGLVEMTRLLSAREQGCMDGRAAAGNPAGVGVFCAGEVNFVLDYQQRARVVQQVLPNVNPPLDMVTYSSYESNNWLYGTSGTNQTATAPIIAQEMNKAFGIIDQLAPDPLHLGKKRILISEYGMFENKRPAGDAIWRTQTILQTAKNAGIAGAFFWELYDNECPNFQNEVGANVGQNRPIASDCSGLWLVRPDGSEGDAVPVIRSFNVNTTPALSPTPMPVTSDIQISAPLLNSSVQNQVNIKAAYTGRTPLDHFEVWVNGLKKTDSLGTQNFSGSNQINKLFDLPLGQMELTVLAIDSRGQVLVKSAVDTFNVNQLSSPGVMIKLPNQNSSVQNAVNINAVYTGQTPLDHFEVWVNGQKRANTTGFQNFSGSNVLNKLFNLPLGQMQLTVLVVDSHGQVIVKSALDVFTVR